MVPEDINIEQIAPCSEYVPVPRYNKKYLIKREENDIEG